MPLKKLKIFLSMLPQCDFILDDFLLTILIKLPSAFRKVTGCTIIFGIIWKSNLINKLLLLLLRSSSSLLLPLKISLEKGREKCK